MEQEFNFESIKNKALEQLKSGKSLLGKDGAFAPLLESILNAALEGEMEAHLSDEERETGNRRNGKMQKQVQTPLGEVTVSTPRDRNSTFDPQFIKKRETILAEGVADRIIGLYALGLELPDEPTQHFFRTGVDIGAVEGGEAPLHQHMEGPDGVVVIQLSLQAVLGGQLPAAVDYAVKGVSVGKL